jgi:hypothetical protein
MYTVCRHNKLTVLELDLNNDFTNSAHKIKLLLGDGEHAVYQKMKDESTIVAQMHYEFGQTTERKIVDLDLIGKLVYVHQEVLRQLLEMEKTGDKHRLTCFVMKHCRKNYERVYCEDIYFQFPFIKTNINNFSSRFLANVKHFFEETSLHEGTRENITNDLDNILSGEVYQNKLWPIPGSYIENHMVRFIAVFDSIATEDVKAEMTIHPATPINYFSEYNFSDYMLPEKATITESNLFYFTNTDGFTVITSPDEQDRGD